MAQLFQSALIFLPFLPLFNELTKYLFIQLMNGFGNIRFDLVIIQSLLLLIKLG